MSAFEPASDGPSCVARQADRRSGWADLMASLAHAIAERADISTLRGIFEQRLHRMVSVRSLRLKDARNRWAGPSECQETAESVAFEVPGVSGGGVLQAAIDCGLSMGDWDYQTLAAAAHAASLILEIDRGRQQLARVGLTPATRSAQEPAVSLIGRTPALKALRAQVERVAGTDFTVLVEGESGVGKELVARQIHELSRRSGGPFVAVNCAALVETLVEAELFGIEERTATGVRGPRGKFEHADGGTLFLDEVSDLSITSQAKLLRAIQDLAVERVGGQGAHRVDVRIVAATNRPLGPLVSQRLFRSDLYFRLSGIDIKVPALRERRGDVLELARHFLERHRSTRPLRLPPPVADALVAYDWPGNVRELERLMERVVALGGADAVELDDLPPSVRGETATMVSAIEGKHTMRAWGSRYARLVLDRNGGNKREACRVLGISYHTLNAYLRYPLHQHPDRPVKWIDPGSDDGSEGAQAEVEVAEV